MKNILILLALTFVNQLVAQRLSFSFDAKGIIVLSDADMVSSAYIDGQLKTENGVTDALTVIYWDSLAEHISTEALNIPNSVTNWVDGMDISNDQKTAFVIDTKGSLPRSIQKVNNVQEDLPKGNMLYAIDISNLRKPVLLDKIKVGEQPLSVDVNPKMGELLVINRERGNEINIIEWKGDKFGNLISKSITIAENAVTHGNWHPNGKYFGLTLEPSSQIAFYEYDNKIIKNVGEPLKVGSFIGAAQFSKSGNYYLVPDLKWNEGYNVNGSMIAVEFSEKGKHKVISTIEVGISPEGFAISPNGQLLAVSNMGTNFMPIDFPLFGQKASISLLAFDENNGQFRLLDTKEWEGILPEGITFDENGDMIAMTSYDYLDLTERKGGVEFWEITNEAGKYELKNTGFKISLTRGSHYLKIIK